MTFLEKLADRERENTIVHSNYGAFPTKAQPRPNLRLLTRRACWLLYTTPTGCVGGSEDKTTCWSQSLSTPYQVDALYRDTFPCLLVFILCMVCAHNHTQS